MRHTGHGTWESREMDVGFCWESLKESLGSPRWTLELDSKRKETGGLVSSAEIRGQW